MPSDKAPPASTPNCVRLWDLTCRLVHSSIGEEWQPQVIVGFRCIWTVCLSNLIWLILQRLMPGAFHLSFPELVSNTQCFLMAVAFIYAVPLSNIRLRIGLTEFYMLTKMFAFTYSLLTVEACTRVSMPTGSSPTAHRLIQCLMIEEGVSCVMDLFEFITAAFSSDPDADDALLAGDGWDSSAAGSGLSLREKQPEASDMGRRPDVSRC